MPREIIDADELLKIINDHMEGLDACRNVHVSRVVEDPARTNGGNWTTSGIRLSGADHDQVECAEVIRDFMAGLQARYDIR
ncbi:hypothetical protein [Burkholderia contaminans]|uniref:hypothetical protein n=1 Tax=Burkholderia contaminans TaxID=488447 RepID=UPI000F56049A|nr:hypothetical protein [Burkholderia contaminans]RQT38360.1 hypothetical protein DF036_06760 [Burkholderia contaminans]